jgi:hypothetical protein
MFMMSHQKNPKNNPYFFPHFFLVYEKIIILKIMIKIYYYYCYEKLPIFYTYYFDLIHGLSKV